MEPKICSICCRKYIGYGNNAWPVNNGRCCDECNGVVVARRIMDHVKNEKLLTILKRLTNPSR